nr:hypothetical protein [Tanacetum cinerariifolium]
YPEVHPPSQEKSEEVSQANEDLINSIQTFLEEFHSIPLEEKPQILLEAWFKFFAIKHDQPKNSNELFQKLLEDLKKLAEYKESLENASNEIATSSSNQEKEDPPQDFDIHLIESALNSKILLINSQRFDKKEQEVKNVVEQPAEPILSIEEPEHSLSMGECDVTFDDEIECDVPDKDNCSPAFTTFSNPLFNDNDDLDSSNDESLPDEDVLAEEFKIYSNPLFDEDEINYDKLDPHCFNVESDFVESLLNRDTFINSSSKFNFSGELAHVNLKIYEFDLDFMEEIHLIENLLYDNSSLRPPEELNAEITNTIIESLPSLPIPVQDGDSQREENDIVTEMDDVLPLSVENDDDPEREINALEELLRDNSIPLTEVESSDSDHQDDQSIPQPPPKPSDAEFDAGKEIPVVMNDKDEDVDYSSFIFVIYPEMFPLLLSAKSEDTFFDPRMSV